MTPSRLRAPLGRAGAGELVGRVFRWSGVLALNYHRIGDPTGSMFDRGLWSADSDAFAQQVRFCKQHFDVISPGDLPDVLARRRGRFLLITFDDGYRDNYEVAFPILRSERVPATFFVATGFIDAPRVPWWDEIAWMVRSSKRDAALLPGWLSGPVRFDEPECERAIRTLLRAYKSLPGHLTTRYLDDIAAATDVERYNQRAAPAWWMTWPMLREMQGYGMTIGGHTVNHPVLARASHDAQRSEIEECAHRLETEMGRPMRYFSYPVGGPSAFNTITRNCLRAAGVQYAFSYYAGYRRFGKWDDYDIRRVPVESYLTRDWFRSILTLPQVFA